MRSLNAKLTRSVARICLIATAKSSAIFLALASGSSLGAGFITAQSASAEIIPSSNNAATAVTVSEPNGHNEQFNITGGQRSSDGSNLFHGFDQFNLNADQTASFITVPDIQNVLSHITGDASNIDGLLQVLGSEANLYLINPAGILFGPNAQLNLPGSFTAATATAIGFDNQWLTLSEGFKAPVDYSPFSGDITAFDFATAGAVVNLGNLTLGSGQSLSLLGGTVVNTGSLVAPGGNVVLTAVEGGQLVRLSQGTLLSLEVSPAGVASLGQPAAISELLTGGDRLEANTLITQSDGSVRLASSNTQIPERSGNLVTSGALSTANNSGTGGEINLFGTQVTLIDAHLNASGQGGGRLRIGGDYQGSLLAPTARRTYIDTSSTLSVNALEDGNGGQAFIWSDESTQFYGDLSARGGLISGDGGFVEISGKRSLSYDGSVDLNAPQGTSGSILFDPFNIVIKDGSGPDLSPPNSLPNLLTTPQNINSFFTIYEETLESFSSVTLEAVHNITIKNLKDNALTFQPGGTVIFRANSDNIGGGDFSMHVSNGSSADAIVAPGGSVIVEGVNIEVGEINTSSDNQALDGNITLTGQNRVAASILNSGAGDIQVTGNTINFNGRSARVQADTLTLQPRDASLDIVLGDTDASAENTLIISYQDLSAANNPRLNRIIIGREDGTGSVDLSSLPEDFPIPITVRPEQPVPKAPEPPTVEDSEGRFDPSETPKVEVPEVEVPRVEVPEIESPEIEIPKVEVPVEVPEIESPELPTSDVPETEVADEPSLPLLNIPLAQVSAVQAAATTGESSSDRTSSKGVTGVILSESDAISSAEVFNQIESSTSTQFENQLSLASGSRQNKAVTLADVQQTLSLARQKTGVRSGLLYAYFVPDAASTDSVLPVGDRTPQPNDQLEVMIISANGNPVRQRQWGVTRADVEAVATEFRHQATRQFSRPSQYLPPAQQLYRWLISPLEDTLATQGINNLAMIMDEGLRTLPLAALHDGNQFLVEKYSLGLMPTFSLTNFGLDKMADKQTESEISSNAQNERQRVLAMGASQFTDQPPLPAVAAELSFISNELWLGKTFLNEAFTLDNLKAQVASDRYNIVHLATHAVFESGDPQNSYIQLWDQRMGLLQLKELGFDQSNIDLLILSACSTAMGDRNSEYGFAGFAINAGSQSAMASLWPVSDEGTLGFMTQFYENLTNAPIRSEALRAAQLALISGDVGIRDGNVYSADNAALASILELQQSGAWNFSHPFYWSAFTMIGSPW